MRMIWGLLFGAAFAAGDALLLRWIVRRSAARRDMDQRWILRGMAARGCLTLAAVAVALLLPFLDAAGVVVALLLQKAALVLWMLLHTRNGG